MKHVENYFIEKYNSGIICLIINTIDKWVSYHEYTKGSYVIGDNDNPEYLNIDIESFLFEPNMKYITTISQNKDQICFYYIPYNLIKDKNNEMSNDKKLIDPTILNKIKVFDYIVYQLILWYNQECGDWKEYNDLTKLKLSKLFFFVVVESTTKNDLGLLKIFNKFEIWPYGHFEADIMSNLDKSIFDISKTQLKQYSDEILLPNETVDIAITNLKKKANHLIKMKPFELVELSYQYTSYIVIHNLGKKMNKLVMPVPVKLIQNDYKYYKK